MLIQAFELNKNDLSYEGRLRVNENICSILLGWRDSLSFCSALAQKRCRYG